MKLIRKPTHEKLPDFIHGWGLAALFSVLILALVSGSSAMYYENENGLLSINPDMASLHSDGVFQNVTFCNYLPQGLTIGNYFMFSNLLSSVDLEYLESNGSWSNYTSSVNYVNQWPSDFGFLSMKNNIYDLLNIDYSVPECKEYKLIYNQLSPGAEWDVGMQGVTDDANRDMLNFEIDPYFNNTLYENTFTSSADINDIDTALSYNVLYGDGYARLSNVTPSMVNYIPMNSSIGGFVDIVGGQGIGTINPAYYATVNLTSDGRSRTGAFHNAGFGTSRVGQGVITNWQETQGLSTMAFWFNLNDSSNLAGDHIELWNHLNSALNARQDIYIDSSDMTLKFSACGQVYDLGYTVNRYNWTYLTWTRDNTNGLTTAYINGVQVSSQITSTCTITDNPAYGMGLMEDNQGLRGSILIASIEHWNDVLTGDQVNQVFTNEYTGNNGFIVNATYGELISKSIPNIGTFQNAICSGTGDFLAGQSIQVRLSNDNGATWNYAGSLNSGTNTCNAITFANPGNTLMYNLTFQNLLQNSDIYTPMLYDFNITILDWNPNVVTYVNYSENVTEGLQQSIYVNITVPTADVVNVTGSFLWNGLSSYSVDDLYNLSFDGGATQTFVKGITFTTPAVQNILFDNIASLFTYNVSTPNYDVINTLPAINQVVNLNFATIKVCEAGDDTIVMYFNNSDEDYPSNSLNMRFEADMQTYNFNYVQLSELNFSVNNTNNIAICLVNNVSVLLNASMTDDTSYAGGKKQRWFLLNQSINNGTIPTISMYNRNSFSSVSQLNGNAVASSNYAPFNGLYVYLERYYPGEALWRIVQQDKTDNNGQFTFNVREVDTDYKLVFIDWYAGILRTTDTLKFLCTNGICNLNFIIPSTPEIVSTFTSSLAFEQTTGIVTASWSDPSQSIGDVRVLVDKEYSNQSQTVICDQTYSSIPDSETCDVSEYDGDVFARIYQHSSDEIPNSEQTFNLGTPQLSNYIDPREAALYIFFLTIVFVLVSLYSPVATVIMMFAGFVGMSMLNISSLLTTSVVMTIGVLCFVVAIRVRH